jgi:putative GTP pyrophosphokinase
MVSGAFSAKFAQTRLLTQRAAFRPGRSPFVRTLGPGELLAVKRFGSPRRPRRSRTSSRGSRRWIPQPGAKLARRGDGCGDGALHADRIPDGRWEHGRSVFYGCPMRYSKSKVDRAGQTLADQLRLVIDGKMSIERSPAVLEAVEIIDWWREGHARPLSRVAANLHRHADQHESPKVTQRLKRFPTVVDKLLREPTMKLSRMADIGGVRAVLHDQAAAYRVASQLRRNWTIMKFRDYVAEPKADGYRALHLINRNRGRLIEVQLRTRLQDAWANSVEADARRVAPGLKFGAGPQVLRDFYVALGELLAIADQGLPADPTLYRRLMELRARVATLRRREHRGRARQ